ncbi:NAD(P)(+) transhydrogenase (AB-specific) [Caballeronia hypogeia]|uniref:NAD(P) transhydrogenase subunit alpha part 1 n=1 Tax=Caballeronia hypogeia TaxID=1777140 RepID=A0A157ZKT4_9BURK|nr:Re/Si-specific NAD(P)(+) transhydrogenase subunit alpha [Caballeronia hypogeia]SAK46105.1 NAD(P)(+) transhydrogenase (AB-specific) [Caballeronia hypogeia]
MLIGIPTETANGETRVAASPETVKKYVAQGHSVRIARGAGKHAAFTDEAYVTAGASLCDDEEALAAELVLKVRAPCDEEARHLKRGALVVGMLEPKNDACVARLSNAGVIGFALEAAPRVTRAQSMDVLSSQANIAGYKAVMIAANHYPRFFPMLMTAAGTVKAARVLVLGAGVAGLQAIATAKRLGATVEASDVRPAVKEQIESLGGKFVDVPFETPEEEEIAKGAGGYARPMPAAWLQRQAALVAERAKIADIIVTTALIPGRAAPVLVTQDMVKSMKAGSVIVDLAAAAGGNCPLTEADRVVLKHGVTIIGHTNLPAMVAADASALYARNVLDFTKLIFDKDGAYKLDLDDEIVKACVLQPPAADPAEAASVATLAE